jgi:hypothetical protein
LFAKSRHPNFAIGVAIPIVNNEDSAILTLDTVGVRNRFSFIKEQPTIPGPSIVN